MILAVVLLLLTVGSVLFHFMSPWWWTPIASNWDYIDHTIIITFWITGVAFVLIICFVAYCVYRFRYREGQEAHYEPENKRLEWWLTIATSLGVAGLLAPGLVDARNRTEQAKGVRVARVVKELVDRTGLDDVAGVHDVDAIRDARDHSQVVGDHDDRHTKLLAEPLDEIKDLGLDRYVERGGWLVGDEQPGLAA